MASARTASLLSRRSSNLYGSGKIRLLSPANNSIATIARQTASNQLDVMVSRYNGGEISNEEMRNFLTKMSTNVGLSPADKLDVEKQIRDFDSRIQGEALVASYKAAPDNSLQQLQAAQALSNFYNAKAQGMAAGTPAQSSALQDAATWDSQALNIKGSIQKAAAQTLRYQEELKVNAIPDNTSEQANQKAQMWQSLYDRAVADGDSVSASKYAAYYQDAVTSANSLSTKESEKENKKTLTDFINTTLNDYHDGKISGEDALANLEEANKFAYDAGDTAALNRLNGLSITINREIDKGVTYSSVNGLSQKSKGGGDGEVYLNPDGSISYGGGSSSGGTSKATGTGVRTSGGTSVGGVSKVGGSGDQSKSISQLEIEYKNNLNEANKALVEGKAIRESDGKEIPFNGNDYKKAILVIAKNRQLQLQNINAGYDKLIASGVKKLGGKQLATLKEATLNDLNAVSAEYNGIRTGRLSLSMGSNESTDPAGNKVMKSQLQWVPSDKVKSHVESNGVYYPSKNSNVLFNDEAQAKSYVKLNSTKDNKLDYLPQPDGTFAIVDKSGEQVSKQEFDLTDPEGNSVSYELDSKYGWIPKPVGPKTTAYRNQIIKEYDAAEKSGQTYKSNLLNYNQLINRDGQTPVGLLSAKPPVEPTLPQKALQGIQAIPQQVASAVQNAPSQVGNSVFNPATQLVPQSAPAIRTAPPATTLKLATQSPSPVAQMAKQNNIAPVKIAAPMKNTPVVNQTQINKVDQQLAAQRAAANNPIGTVINKLKSFFKF